jgi:ribonuclease E
MSKKVRIENTAESDTKLQSNTTASETKPQSRKPRKERTTRKPKASNESVTTELDNKVVTNEESKSSQVALETMVVETSAVETAVETSAVETTVETSAVETTVETSVKTQDINNGTEQAPDVVTEPELIDAESDSTDDKEPRSRSRRSPRHLRAAGQKRKKPYEKRANLELETTQSPGFVPVADMAMAESSQLESNEHTNDQDAVEVETAETVELVAKDASVQSAVSAVDNDDDSYNDTVSSETDNANDQLALNSEATPVSTVRVESHDEVDGINADEIDSNQAVQLDSDKTVEENIIAPEIKKEVSEVQAPVVEQEPSIASKANTDYGRASSPMTKATGDKIVTGFEAPVAMPHEQRQVPVVGAIQPGTQSPMGKASAAMTKTI